MRLVPASDLAHVASAKLDSYIATLSPRLFEELCVYLISAEGFRIKSLRQGLDAFCELDLMEPPGFVRIETWGFDFKLFQEHRLSISEVRAAVGLASSEREIDIMCLVTSGEITSVARKFVTDYNYNNIRLWDRTILGELMARHNMDPDNPQKSDGQAAQKFRTDPKIAEFLRKAAAQVALVQPANQSTLLEKFRMRLDGIPAGKKHFAAYEKTVAEIVANVFVKRLGPPQPQTTTIDGVQRRDILFKNQKSGEFWCWVYDRCGCNFLIVDAKNYGNAIGPDVIETAAKYTNDALGRLVLLVSRKGSSKTAIRGQIRVLTGPQKALVLSISDEQLLEMVRRKERGMTPEDVLEDAKDAILLQR